MNVREAELGHGQVRFVDEGHGPALLLIHGLGGNWQNWQANLPGLAHRYRVIAPDLPGFGTSPPYTGAVSMARYADTLVELLDARGVESAAFVGNSMGGLLSIEAAVRHPDRVHAAVLVCSAGIPLTTLRHRAVLRPGALALNATLRHERIRHAALRWPRVRHAIAARIVHRPGHVDAGHLVAALDGLGTRKFGTVLRAALRYDARPRVSQLTCPTLIVWGRHDRLLPTWMGHELHDLIEDSQLVVWDGTGHCPMIEHPRRFNELVDEFVGQDFGRSDGEALPTGG